MFASDLTATDLRHHLAYDAETGIFTRARVKAKGNRFEFGSKAGSITDSGYVRIAINRRAYFAHRLAWLYHYGEHAPGFIDHINRDKCDNRISNLRVVDKRSNCQNRERANVNSGHGWLGATFRPRQGWASTIGVLGTTWILGYFDSPEEAHLMYLFAKHEFHPGWVP